MKREQCKTPNCRAFALCKGLCKTCYNRMANFRKKKKGEPLWKPDKYGEYHLGDLMYAIEDAKKRR